MKNLSKRTLKKYFKSEYFTNRELSWLEFNRRVLEEALNPDLPLLDKIKFISIFLTNLDEFYMIRVSGIKEQVRAAVIEPKLDGLTPTEELNQIEQLIQPMLQELYKLWFDEILPGLKKENILISKFEEFSDDERTFLTGYFYSQIYPVLTPLAFDPGRPFPYISNLSLSFAILVKKISGESHFARVKIPSILPRLLRIDTLPGFEANTSQDQFTAKYIWLDDLIKNNLAILFPGVDIVSAHRFRITRDTDLEIQEDEADDLLELIEENIKQRKFGFVVRLEVEADMPDFMIDTLIENLEIQKEDIHIIEGPLGLGDIMLLYSLPLHHLKEKPFHPVVPQIFEEDDNIFNIIRNNDILLHHPYDSFNPTIDFIKRASQDPDVLAIKQTLYRVGANSPVVKYLIEAAERRKQVAVLVELKARFDEENNIFWARELEKAGVHVVYGLVGLKTHAKMTLVVRREFDGVKRYVHLGTGNYNPFTAKLYTDFGLFTCDTEISADVSEIFNFLTGYSEQKIYRKLHVAPINIREYFLKFIQREIGHAKGGKKAEIIFKMNSLVDPTIIAALYEASCAGVKIELVIRGICCLVPQIPGISDNICVRSIVGRFLEHSRIYYFYNGGDEEIYMSSADLMQRNLDRRVETTFPVEDPLLKKSIIESVLRPAIEDTVKARILLPTGKYVFNRAVLDQKHFSLQEELMKDATKSPKKIIKREAVR